MELYKLEPQISVSGITELHIASISIEESPPQPEPSTFPETPKEMVPQTPVELVCQSPLEGSAIETNNKMRVLIVDDNDINLKVSDIGKSDCATF